MIENSIQNEKDHEIQTLIEFFQLLLEWEKESLQNELQRGVL